MRPTELTVMLAAAIKHHAPIMITGAPGIGKSDIVTQAAKAADANMILSHPAVSDPTDVKGLPWVVDGHATFLPFGDLDQAMNAEKETVWFLDDLGQASPAVQAGCMQLLLAREVNGHKLSPHVTMFAATNRRTDRAGVTGILEPVKARFFSILELEAHLDDWCNWAIDHQINPIVIALLRFKPDLLSAFTASADMTNSPTPRTWHHASQILSWGLPPNIEYQALGGAVGAGAATELAAFQRTWRELPNIDHILIDPDAVPVPEAPATLYALAGALANRTTNQNFDRVAKFIDKMIATGHGEFGVLTIRDAIRRHSTITATQAFVHLATGELGELISGS